MKTKLLIIFSASFFLWSHLQAQAVDSSICRSYSPSIVAKIYEVTRHINVTPQQQQALAAAYNSQDSAIAEWVLQNRPQEQIDSLQGMNSMILPNVLGTVQAVEYGQRHAAQFASLASVSELQFIKEEYKPDSLSEAWMKKALQEKYSFIYQNAVLGMESKTNVANAIKIASMAFDGYNFYPALYSRRFLTDYFIKLSAIKKIPDSTLRNIKTMFYGFLKTNKYADWSLSLKSATQYFLPDTSIFSKLYRSDFEKQAYELSAADSYNLIYLHKVSPNAYHAIYKLIEEKNYKKAVLDYTFSAYHHEKYDELIHKTMQYYDSAVEASLLRDGALLPATQFAIALRYKLELKLRPTLTDTLLHHAMYLAKQRDSILLSNPFATVDFGVYESKFLNELLTEDQYTKLLWYKNNSLALSDAKNDWDEMEVRGITKGFEKEETIRNIANFYLNKYIVWNRLVYDKIKLWATQYSLGEFKPAALKILDPLRWSGATKSPTNNLEIKW